jgi:hypothetical protein
MVDDYTDEVTTHDADEQCHHHQHCPARRATGSRILPSARSAPVDKEAEAAQREGDEHDGHDQRG